MSDTDKKSGCLVKTHPFLAGSIPLTTKGTTNTDEKSEQSTKMSSFVPFCGCRSSDFPARSERALIKLLQCILIILSVFLLASCSSDSLKNKIGDGGLISNSPCVAPCFFNVLPDTTTKEQTIDSLQRQDFSQYCDISQNITCGQVIFIRVNTKNYVEAISFSPSTSITLKSLVEKFGAPDSLNIVDQTLTPESPFIQAGLYLDSINTYLELSVQKGFDYKLAPDTLVSKVFYLGKLEYSNLKASSKHQVAWKGYGVYSDPAPNAPAPNP